MTAEATTTPLAVDAPAAPARDPRRATLALLVAGACSMVVGYTATGVNIAFPALESHFSGTSRSTLSWGVAGYSIVLAALLLPGGRLADLRGRRRLFVRGMAVFGAGSIALVLAPWAWLFLAGRVVQAVGAAVVIPGAVALVLPEYPDDRRLWVAGMVTSLVTFGQAFAPTVAAVLIDTAGWRAAFVPPVLASVVGVGAGRRVFRETAPHEDAGPVDRVGFPMGPVAVGLLAFAVMEGPRWGWSAPPVLGSLLGAAVLFPAFVLRSARHPRPLLDPKVVSRRAVWAATSAFFFVASFGQTMWFLLPLFLHAARDASLLVVGLSMTPMAIASAIAGNVGTRVAQRTGRPRPVALLGAALSVAGVAWFLAFAASERPFVVALLPAMVVAGAGIGFSQGPLAGLSLLDVEPRSFGQVNGIFHTVRFVAAGLGTALVVAVVGDDDTIPDDAFRRMFAVQLALMVVCLLFEALALPGRRGRRGPGRGV